LLSIVSSSLRPNRRNIRITFRNCVITRPKIKWIISILILEVIPWVKQLMSVAIRVLKSIRLVHMALVRMDLALGYLKLNRYHLISSSGKLRSQLQNLSRYQVGHSQLEMKSNQVVTQSTARMRTPSTHPSQWSLTQPLLNSDKIKTIKTDIFLIIYSTSNIYYK